MSSSKKIKRVFIGPVEICGISEGLAVGLKSLKIDAQVCLSSMHPFEYGLSNQDFIYKMWTIIGEHFKNIKKKNIIKKILTFLVYKTWSWVVFFNSIFHFNAFIFIFGQTITNSRLELALLSFFKKPIVFIYVGSDSRPPYINGSIISSNRWLSRNLKQITRLIKNKISTHENHTKYLINSPYTAQFHNNFCINWFAMGIPRVFPNYINKDIDRDDCRIRILHSPSNPIFKGTEVIEGVVERLKNKGYPIDFIIIKGMPNKTVLLELSRCDFVVDQLYSDTPLAVFATEAAFYGKPAVVGGYGFDKLRSLVPESMWPPSKTCHPDDIEQAIEDMIVNKEERERLGAEVQKFVRERWDATEVARRYLQLIAGDVPDKWWFDPKRVSYVEGAGQSAEQTKEKVRRMVKKYGSSSLQLSHRPELELAFLEYAGVKGGEDASGVFER